MWKIIKDNRYLISGTVWISYLAGATISAVGQPATIDIYSWGLPVSVVTVFGFTLWLGYKIGKKR